MKDLSTRYLGLTLRSPLVASAGPLAGSLAGITALAEAGVGAVVLPFTVSSGFRLSEPAEAALPRAWVSRLHGFVRGSLAASTGVESPGDAAAYLLAGADVVMTTSSLLRHGPDHARVLLDGLRDWMGRKGFASAGAVRGLLARAPEGEPAYGRAGYLSAVEQASHAYSR